MHKPQPDLPRCLTKLGIHTIKDNLQPGQQIGGFTADIVRLFGAELMAALQTMQDDRGASQHEQQRHPAV